MPVSDKKAKIAIDKVIDMFGETKHKGSPPAWVAARPDKIKMVPSTRVKRTLEVDGRKWKKKVIEDGIYAVARYELAVFATKIAPLEKDIMKARGKGRQKAKFIKGDKNETADETKALDAAVKTFNALHKKLAQAIIDKVDIALDEIESDTGDNKRALAKGKEALTAFNKLDTSKLFKPSVQAMEAVYEKLAAALAKAPDDAEKACAEAHKAAVAADTEFDKTGRVALNAIKHMQDNGKTMKKDDGANPLLVEIGKTIVGPSTLSKQLDTMASTIDDHGAEMEKAVEFFKKPKGKTRDLVNNAKRRFLQINSGRDAKIKGAVEAVKQLGKDYSAAAKEVK